MNIAITADVEAAINSERSDVDETQPFCIEQLLGYDPEEDDEDEDFGIGL